MSNGRKSVDPLLSLERIEENCGCRGRNSDWREWVFPGEGKGPEKPFRLAYRDLARARGEVPPEDPHPGLFFRRGVEDSARTGEDAERLFFSSFGFLVDFFAQPDNAQELGGILRQFMSRYCGEGVLGGVPRAARSELSRAEDALMRSCGDGHAHATDTLRLIYNGAMAMLLGSGTGAKIGAVHLGEGGRKLTPIGTPPALAKALDREEGAVRGGVFCVDARTGRCYGRGGWTEGEWTEAAARIEAESGGSPVAKRMAVRALDSHYFPEKVTSAVAMRSNLVAELRDDALVHCRQGTTFSAVRLAARLGGAVEPVRGGGHGCGGDIVDFPHRLEDEFADADDGRYLPAPSSFEEMMPDETGLEALETAEAKGAGRVTGAEEGKEAKAAGGGKAAGRARGRGAGETAEDKAGRMARKFFRERGGGTEEEEARLREIFKGGELGPGDYDPSQGCFVAAASGDPGGDPAAWRRRAGEARDFDEAERLVRGLLRRSSSRTAGVALPGEDGVFLASRTADGVVVRKVGAGEFDREAGVSRGKITYGGGSYIAVGEVRRVPFGEPGGAEPGRDRGTRETGRIGPLGRGSARADRQGAGISGIFGALKRAFRGGR